MVLFITSYFISLACSFIFSLLFFIFSPILFTLSTNFFDTVVIYDFAIVTVCLNVGSSSICLVILLINSFLLAIASLENNLSYISSFFSSGHFLNNSSNNF